MKKKMTALLLAVLVCLTGNVYSGIDVRAEELGEDIDFSYLLTDDTLVGFAENQARGIYLSDGHSFINEMSATKIGAGGLTNASLRCRVSVTSIVERKTSDGWVRVTSWTQTNENAFSAMISKSLSVGTGYYYRVRSLHYAGTDGSSSCTNALPM